ncbi:DUF3108 domain-containing protein [Niabella insulamsoli]|uniref:DUF3108 domain-containing protein n=1 Tax=Niabella insulamsoli TaxID=3144874 RepID=UPI0031FCB9D9
MKALRLSILALFSIAAMAGAKQPETQSTTIAPNCGINNTAFKAGEKVEFVVYYTAAKLINVTAGAGSFTTTLEKLNGKSVYHVVGEGHTLPSYEWAYKAKDTYETFMDVETLQPLKFVRNINEGGYKKYQNVSFNKSANTAISSEGVFKIPACAHDVVSAVFYARNIDFNRLKPGVDRVPFTVFLDNETHPMQIRYLGKETISTKYGKFKTVKIKPSTIKGTIFKDDDQMTVWVTDDANHVPVRIESPIIVGKVRIDMTNFQNLRNPMSALVKKY